MSDLLAQPYEDQEAWINSTQATIVVKKIGETGRLVDEIIPGGRRLEVTPQERRINSEKANSQDQDFFKNGTLQPIRLIEGDKDLAAIQDNPNVMPDSEMRGLFSLQWKAFEKRISDVTSPLLVRRLIAIANEPDTNCSVRALDTLVRRMDALEPKVKDAAEEIKDLG